MDQDDKEMIERVYRMTRENNQMLHSMRRSAFIGGIIRIIVWAVLLGFPIWLYIQYVNPVLSSLVDTINQVQSTGTQFGEQFGELNDFMQKIKEKIPGTGI